MKTIDSLLKHNLNEQQKLYLEVKGYMNGCGGKWGFNFSKFIDRVKKMFNFKSKKLNSFTRDLKRLCSENHDIDFTLGGGIRDYFKANYDFVCWILALLHWTDTKARIIVFVLVFIPLTVLGVTYFKWGKKKTLFDLLGDMQKEYLEVQQDTCLDQDDERDYSYSEILWLWERDRDAIIDLETDYQNQGLEEITKFMCVYYSNSHNSNIMNFLEGSDVRTTWKDLWLEAESKGMLDVKKGAYLSDWPKLLKQKGLISGYVKVSTLDEIKDSIFNKSPVSVWSNKIKWSAVKVAPFTVIEGNSYWHAFLIIWYDDDKKVFICKNSYGKDKYDNGRFYLKYEDIGLLFNSKYSLVDTVDPIVSHKEKIKSEINIEKAKEAFDLWIWNWKDPKKEPTREEVATMVLRWLEKLKNWEI